MVPLTIILLPKLGSLTIPVSFYILAIGFMGLTAAFATQGFSRVFIGAIIFMVSDAMIAITKFISPFPAAGILIMVTYYLGNFLIGFYGMKLAELQEIR